MVYQSTIPQANDQLATSQSDLLNNFGAVNTYLNVNHVTFNGSDQGKHVFITFPIQTVNPSITPGFTATEVGLYNFNYTVTGKNELFINKIAGTGSVQKPMTASILSNNATPAQGTTGWSYLPSGLLIMWGTRNSVSGTVVQTVLSGVNVPTYTQILHVQLTPFSAAASSTFSVKLMALVNSTTFNVFVSSTGGYNWYTIGY